MSLIHCSCSVINEILLHYNKSEEFMEDQMNIAFLLALLASLSSVHVFFYIQSSYSKINLEVSWHKFANPTVLRNYC